MLPASLPQISLGTAAVLIFAGCLGYLMLRGIGKLLVGTAMLALSALLGFLTWQAAPEWSLDGFGKSVGLVTTGLPIGVVVVSFILIRLVLKWVASPFGGSDSKDKDAAKGRLTIARTGFLAGVALIPTLLLMVIAVGFIHHTASVDELRQQAETQPHPRKTYAQQLKESLESVVPPSLLNAIDPYAERSRLALAKWITRRAAEDGKLEPAIDPETGEVIPRAIIVGDAELERLARERKFGTLLRHPVITRALENPDVRKLVDDLRF